MNLKDYLYHRAQKGDQEAEGISLNAFTGLLPIKAEINADIATRREYPAVLYIDGMELLVSRKGADTIRNVMGFALQDTDKQEPRRVVCPACLKQILECDAEDKTHFCPSCAEARDRDKVRRAEDLINNAAPDSLAGLMAGMKRLVDGL